MRDHPSKLVSLQTDCRVDRWLRFDTALNRRYEAENATARTEHLREVIYVGLALFNVHNLTDAFLMPDIIWLAVILRLIVVTPAVLVASSYLARMSAAYREQTILLIVAGAFASEAVFLWTTRSPLGNYAFSEFGLTLVYGNMLAALRFRHAVSFTVLSFLLACVAIWQKPVVDDALRVAFVVQITMACIISLYANYKMERRRCSDYIVKHLAIMRAEQSEQAKRRFQDQSLTDALTGLPNRRLLDERLEEWFSDNLPVAVMMIDIDYFKLFNDKFGHPAGDDCLRQIGAVLAATQTPDIFCARFGGEEFTVAVRSDDKSGIARMANALVCSIEALKIPHPKRSDGGRVVTASVGVAFRPSGRQAMPHDIVAAADRSLYRAKRMGRNCVVLDETDGSLREAAA